MSCKNCLAKEKSGLIDTSQKHWCECPYAPEFLQLRLFGGVKIKKNPRENLKKPLTIAQENVLKDFIKVEEWPW